MSEQIIDTRSTVADTQALGRVGAPWFPDASMAPRASALYLGALATAVAAVEQLDGIEEGALEIVERVADAVSQTPSARDDQLVLALDAARRAVAELSAVEVPLYVENPGWSEDDKRMGR